MYQNPTKFEDTIEYFEFDGDTKLGGNHFITYVEWDDKYGDKYYGRYNGEEGREIPDHIRLQLALMIAGDLVVPK